MQIDDVQMFNVVHTKPVAPASYCTMLLVNVRCNILSVIKHKMTGTGTCIQNKQTRERKKCALTNTQTAFESGSEAKMGRKWIQIKDWQTMATSEFSNIIRLACAPFFVFAVSLCECQRMIHFPSKVIEGPLSTENRPISSIKNSNGSFVHVAPERWFSILKWLKM